MISDSADIHGWPGSIFRKAISSGATIKKFASVFPTRMVHRKYSASSM